MLFDDYGFLRKQSNPVNIDLTNLIDVVFVLLIFFVITTTFSQQTGLDVQKPKAASAVTQGAQTIMVGISREGAIHIHGRQVTEDELEQIVGREISIHPDAAAVIVGDRGATLGRSVEVMDLCSRSGVTKVSIAADQQK